MRDTHSSLKDILIRRLHGLIGYKTAKHELQDYVTTSQAERLLDAVENVGDEEELDEIIGAKNNTLVVTNIIPLNGWEGDGNVLKIGSEEFEILPFKKNEGQLFIMTDGKKSVAIRLRRKNGQKAG